MAKFRKRPVVIEAVQLLWTTWSEMCEHAGVGKLIDRKPEGCFIGPDGTPLPEGQTSEEIGLVIPTLEGLMVARQNDWVIRGIKRELYPCKPDIFEMTYETLGETIIEIDEDGVVHGPSGETPVRDPERRANNL